MPDILFHFSEDPSIARFEPRVAMTYRAVTEAVWPSDPEHAHPYYYPRACPRVTLYATDRASAEDRERFLGLTLAHHVAAIELGWLERMHQAKLYRYTMPVQSFQLEDAGAGYWLSQQTVTPMAVEPVG